MPMTDTLSGTRAVGLYPSFCGQVLLVRCLSKHHMRINIDPIVVIPIDTLCLSDSVMLPEQSMRSG